ncbi:carboxymethylenebutenolidase [Stanieria cyanosphaera PCC 7437]|uniref:Carboxymethylenebutenolidase n=1 Tax=Stanieria cyanosphaera (strain ATCC 29371 / PCC 7437) TaxID=111780 RepID=K9XSD4_STAC7|nr:dienelactone hydrolase family protein [Stanieria cyanosphaera]AFZ35510.1 carboxymethylenebutenolidase [Stanieria cyanosphaera PCC 7437]
MTALEIATANVQIVNGDLKIHAYLANPTETETKYPGIVVIQEIFGVNSHIRDITERLAKSGYVAIAPAIYQRQAPGFEVGYSDEDMQIGRKYKEQTTAQELISDIQATIDYLYALPQVKPEGVGTIGFCFGGHVAYLVATLEDIKATASFYGAGITNSCPGGGEPTITRTKDIKGTIYTFFGTEDPLIPNEQVDEIEAQLNQNQIPHQVFRYEGATHGFVCDQRSSYNPKAAQSAWQKVLDLFSQILK